MVPLTSRRFDIVAVVLVGLVALIARMAIALTVPEHPPVYDMLEYWERAIHIAEQGRLYENSWRMPGYPEALALVFWLASGPSLAAARLLNVAAGVATTVLTYWLARRTASLRVSLAPALVVAVYPSFLIYTTFVVTEGVVAVPLLGALIAATYATSRAALVAGACAGLGALVRPASIALLPAVLMAFARQRASGDGGWKSLRRPALVAATFIAAMTPWWMHNARLHGRFIPLDTTGGYNVLIGNGPYATGQLHWRELSRLHTDHLQGIDVSTPTGSSAATQMAITHVRAHPLATAALAPRKVVALLSIEGREHMALYSSGYFGPFSAGVVWIWGVSTIVAFPLLLTAAVAGCAVRRGIDGRVLYPCLGFLAATVILHIVTFGEPRFHMPLVPVFAVLATGLAGWRNSVDPRRAIAGALLLLCLVGPWSRQIGAYGAALVTMAAPDGWQNPLPYIDLR